jgi:hypothetical protein
VTPEEWGHVKFLLYVVGGVCVAYIAICVVAGKPMEAAPLLQNIASGLFGSAITMLKTSQPK